MAVFCSLVPKIGMVCYDGCSTQVLFIRISWCIRHGHHQHYRYQSSFQWQLFCMRGHFFQVHWTTCIPKRGHRRVFGGRTRLIFKKYFLKNTEILFNVTSHLSCMVHANIYEYTIFLMLYSKIMQREIGNKVSFLNFYYFCLSITVLTFNFQMHY
jgi:hypothetical protein